MTELPTLQGETLVLRPWAASDAADLQREIQDPEIVRWLGIELPYTLDDAEGFIEKTSRQWEARQAAQFVIADRATGEFIGYLGVLSVLPGMKVVEVVCWIGADFRRRRFATQALETVVPWIEEEIGPERIELGMIEGNVVSAAIAESAGFDLYAIIIGGATLDGEPANERIYELNHEGVPR